MEIRYVHAGREMGCVIENGYGNRETSFASEDMSKVNLRSTERTEIVSNCGRYSLELLSTS